MRSPLRLVLVVLAACISLSACAVARPPAAVVDGEPITDGELAQQMHLFTFLDGLFRQSCGQADTSIGETAEAACARYTLSNLIQEDVVRRYASEHDITLSASDVSDAVSRLEASLGGAGELDKRLQASGIPRSQFDDLARRLVLFSKTQTAIGSAGVTDRQLHALYDQQKQQFTEIHAKHILVKTRAEAVRIAARATPQNFAALARKYSTDTSSAAKGGDLGTVPASSLDPNFVRAALALSPGAISAPVHTQFGWHVIMLVSASVQPFDRVKAQLVSSLQGQAYGSWLRDRLQSADIRVNPKYGRFDTSSGEVVPIRSTEAVPSPSAVSPAVTPSP